MRSKDYKTRIALVVLSLLFAIPYAIIAHAFILTPFLSVLLISIVIFYLILGNLTLIKHRKLRLIYVAICILELCLLFYTTIVKPPFLSGVDWINFHNYAVSALNSDGSILDIYSKSLDLFVFFIALIYKVFGIFINQIYFYVFATSLLLFRYVYKTVKLLSENETIAVGAGLTVMAWPVNLIFSVSVLREIPIQLAVAISFYNFVKYLKAGQTKNLIGALVFSVLATLMHSGMIAVLIAYLYVLTQGSLTKKRRIISLRALILASAATFILMLTPLGTSVTGRFAGITSIDDLNNTYAFQLDATTTYITSTATSFAGFIATAPYRFVMFSVAPLPWQVRNFNTLVSFLIDGILQLLLVSFIYRTLKRSKVYTIFMKNVAMSAIICIVLTYFIFAMGTNNYGSAMRHRAKVLPVEVILISTYFVSRQNNAVKTGLLNATKAKKRDGGS